MMNNFSLATLGGHSALEICLGAKKNGFKTVVILQKGREKTYSYYYKNLVDTSILVDHFSELTDTKIVQKLLKLSSIFIPHRYCQVYCDMNKLENDFPVPILGNKHLLKYEEREGKYTQYELLQKANIPTPEKFRKPKNIHTLAIIKVREKKRRYERAFFFASSYEEYKKKSEELIRKGKIDKADLEDAIIEEYLIGAQVNFNFFYSPLTQHVELLGTDARRQTNIDGLSRIPMSIQKEFGQTVSPSYIETGHFAVTVKESLLENAFELAEKLIVASHKIHPKGIIGPFALQTAVLAGPPKEQMVVYDLSLRMPGSPGIMATPYSQYHYGHPVTFGERIAMEIQSAVRKNSISTITT